MAAFDFLAQADLPAKWRAWPFNSGTAGDWQTSLATYAFSALILGVICLFLRKLYGPGGIWRDKELEREAEELRRQELAELERQLASGKISEPMYELKKKELLR
jgi:putative membrane protein